MSFPSLPGLSGLDAVGSEDAGEAEADAAPYLCDPPTGGPTYCRPLSGCRRPVYYVAIRSSFGPLCLDMARPDPRARRVRVRSAISTPNRIAFEAMKVVEGRDHN